MKRAKATTIDEYISFFPKEIRQRLQMIRAMIRMAAPDAKEKISYAIPAFQLNGSLIYFAAFREHISLYPAPRGVKEFASVLSKFKGGKGTVQFPHNTPLPSALIKKIVRYRIEQNKIGKPKKI